MDEHADRDDRTDLVDLGTTLAAQAVVGSINAAVATWQFARDVRQLVGSLARITAVGGPIDRVADLADEVRPLVAEIRTISASLRQLADFTDSLERIARLGDSLERLARAGESVPALADRAAAIPELVTLVRDVEGRFRQVAGRLDTLGPDIGTLAGMIGELQQSVRVLGGTIGPLQGTAERVGRLVERFGGNRRPVIEDHGLAT